jgi:hypothetical protein
MAARSAQMDGIVRVVGSCKSVMLKRIPLLPVSHLKGARRKPSHVDDAMEFRHCGVGHRWSLRMAGSAGLSNFTASLVALVGRNLSKRQIGVDTIHYSIKQEHKEAGNKQPDLSKKQI